MNKQELMVKFDEFLKANGRQELSMEDLDQVVGGFTEDQLTEEELAYLEKLKEALASAIYSDSKSEMGEIAQLMAEFNEKMSMKYDQ